jgi:hypothetical protein
MLEYATQNNSVRYSQYMTVKNISLALTGRNEFESEVIGKIRFWWLNEDLCGRQGTEKDAKTCIRTMA